VLSNADVGWLDEERRPRVVDEGEQPLAVGTGRQLQL